MVPVSGRKNTKRRLSAPWLSSALRPRFSGDGAKSGKKSSGRANSSWTSCRKKAEITAASTETVEIKFINQLSQPSTINWHGLPISPKQDGNPMDPVPPGGLLEKPV